jgi:hypothetical protein
MPVKPFAFTTLAMVLTSIGVAGCSAAPGSVAPTVSSPSTSGRASASFLDNSRVNGYEKPSSSTPKRFVYVADDACSCVEVYPLNHRNPKPIRSIAAPGGIGQIAVDSQGTLYIPQFGNSDVLEFTPGSTTPTRTLTSPTGENPTTLGVDQSGTVYVGNVSGDVAIYANGATTPTTTIAPPAPLSVTTGIAVDSNFDIFTAQIIPVGEGTTGVLGEYAHSTDGSYKFRRLTGPSSRGDTQFDGLSLDATGNIVTDSDQGDGPKVLVFSRPAAGHSKLTKSFGSSWGNAITHYTYNGSQYVLVADGIDGAVVQYAYPSGKQINEIINGLNFPEGVAVSP